MVGITHHLYTAGYMAQKGLGELWDTKLKIIRSITGVQDIITWSPNPVRGRTQWRRNIVDHPTSNTRAGITECHSDWCSRGMDPRRGNAKHKIRNSKVSVPFGAFVDDMMSPHYPE